jgi:hypothetical protein
MNAIQQLSVRITRRLAPDAPSVESRRRALRARFCGTVARVSRRPVSKGRSRA